MYLFKNKPFQVLYPPKKIPILNLMFKIEPHIVYYDQCPIDDMLEPINLSSCFFIFLNTNWNIIMQFNFFLHFFRDKILKVEMAKMEISCQKPKTGQES